MEDVCVIGGGPAGLAAALWLGRFRRQTVVLDAGEQRNRMVEATHGYLGFDGESPKSVLTSAHRDLARYETVRHVEARVDSVARDGDDFVVTAGDTTYRAHRLILATGVADACPDLPGFAELYGRSIFHCPTCDGYEACDQPVIAIGWGEQMAGFALDLLDWGGKVTVVTNGNDFQGDDDCQRALERHEVELIEEKVVSIKTENGEMTGVETDSGRVVPGGLAFFSIEHHPRNELAEQLGCEIGEDGRIQVDEKCQTSVENVYAVGDVTPGEQLVQVAVAKGTIAGVDCAQSLRGIHSRSPAPTPGPDPAKELSP